MSSYVAQSSDPLESLRSRLEGEVHGDDYYRALYSTDASVYQIRPRAVVLPRSLDDVARAVAWARDLGWPLIPRGGGTSLSGQSIGDGVIIDFSRWLNRIVEIDPTRQTARVEPGVVLDQLNAAAAAHGLQFAPDVATSSRANLGGMIGNNSAGARSVWYGKTVDHVIELDALLADGAEARLGPASAAQILAGQQRADRWGEVYRQVPRIIERERAEILARYPAVLRRVSGYNLDEFVPECRARLNEPRWVHELRSRERQHYPDAQFNLARLIVGAEGTLATVTGALVHLVPLPKVRGVVVLHFNSIDAAVASIERVLECDPSAAELLDGRIVRLAEQSLEYRHYLDFVVGRPASLMLVEFSGQHPEEVRSKAEQLIARLRGEPGLEHVLSALEPALCAHIWACRKAALPLLQSVTTARQPVAFVEDTAVNPPRLAEFFRRFQQVLAEHGTEGAYYGHASVGCLHIRPLLDLSARDDIERFRQISQAICDLVIEFGGAMSGEHGDGLARSYLNEKLFGPRLYRAFVEIKQAFDPAGRMNPGKIVDGPSPTDNLRLGADYKTVPLATTFAFREGSFVAAAAMCNGSGVCRKTQTGTMCPSYMVTRDEEHSTRGRANALRLALSGALPPAEFAGTRMFETFALCLECKGCKAECPSNVDVAKLKMEFLDHYYRRHGRPLGVRLMAQVGRLNRLGSALAPLANFAGNLPGAGWLAEQLLGVDRRRPLPTFEWQNFRRWFAGRSPRMAAAPRGPVVLLDDCLTSYCEPAVNRAAVEVLEKAGYEVHLAGLDCCGRTFASKGQLTEARDLARANLKRLLPWATRRVPIVGTEPSCVAMLADDYRDLVPGDDSRQVADHVSLVEDLLAAARPDLALRPVEGTILVHGHCHQKALFGMGGTKSALELIPAAQVQVVDSGCCGMAGSFGYEHYDLSMSIGERVLLPAVRAHKTGPIVAPGFSCRSQIAHGTERQALHPVELIRRQMTDSVAEAKSDLPPIT